MSHRENLDHKEQVSNCGMPISAEPHPGRVNDPHPGARVEIASDPSDPVLDPHNGSFCPNDRLGTLKSLRRIGKQNIGHMLRLVLDLPCGPCACLHVRVFISAFLRLSKIHVEVKVTTFQAKVARKRKEYWIIFVLMALLREVVRLTLELSQRALALHWGNE